MQNRDIEQDLKKLAEVFFHELTIVNIEYGGVGLDPKRPFRNIEYGGVGLDPKRPFRNSDVEGDVLEILGITGEDWCNGYEEFSDAQRLYAKTLYWERLIPYLKRRRSELP